MQTNSGWAGARPIDAMAVSGRLLHAASPGDGDADFAAMRAAYQATGGFARGDDLARLLEDRGRGDFASLARLIVGHEVFGFEWRHALWIPMFQFNAELGLKPGLKAVLAELASEYDGQRLAAWFVEPNGWLEQARPIDVLDADPAEVLQAARADRFVATG
ncbi:MAG: hypothetical protein K8R60_21385 [Burkholderiales bacterium]|nr:hypothetical protein [Burkholderiales bacterium]